MDEEPFIIATMMAEEERRHLEKKAAEEQRSPLHNTYQPFQYNQPASRARVGWIIIGIIIVVIYLIFRF